MHDSPNTSCYALQTFEAQLGSRQPSDFVVVDVENREGAARGVQEGSEMWGQAQPDGTRWVGPGVRSGESECQPCEGRTGV